MVSGIKTFKSDDTCRLDVLISSKIDSYTRSYFTGLISDGKVTVNGKTVTKAGYKVAPGDEITVDIPEPLSDETVAQDIPLDILYEDDDLIIINKPQGMVVHPGAGHHDQTLVNALLAHCEGNLSDINGVIRPGIVHRIDKDTSGVMMAVKNNDMHIAISDMLSRHEIERVYRTVVYGVISEDEGTIDAPIGRSSKDRRKMTVVEDGKPSVTHFKVVNRYREGTDLEVKLETGRTHQIRAHMTYIGHPVFGDPLYASKRNSYGLEGQCLHSKSIRFVHPRTGEELYFETELPEYYEKLLQSLTLL
ncbi:MAG: RluA family pseudouridine synthase [Clostridiales bacterium]|nr:RluA family pseudouridine synthase [Clostridiales bacterium]MBP3810179.1 RluA family pseudouridine synthase [Clostridiales bacterium]